MKKWMLRRITKMMIILKSKNRMKKPRIRGKNNRKAKLSYTLALEEEEGLENMLNRSK